MHDTDLYARIVGIQLPRRLTEVALCLEAGEVQVEVAADRAAVPCPACGRAAGLWLSEPRALPLRDLPPFGGQDLYPAGVRGTHTIS